MANLALDAVGTLNAMKKLYVDEDGFTSQDCNSYLQLVSGATLGDEQKAIRRNQCAAITEYIRAADSDSFNAKIRSAVKLVLAKAPPVVLGALVAMDWRQALQDRLPFLLERLTNDNGACGKDIFTDCVSYIDDIAKMGPYATIVTGQLGRLAAADNYSYRGVNAHARVALEKVAGQGKVEERIKELAGLIAEPKENKYEHYKNDWLTEEAAEYAGFPQYTKAVNDAFAPLLSDEKLYMWAVTAIAGGGKRSRYMVRQILGAAPIKNKYFDGDELMHKLEKILDYYEVRRLRKLTGW